MRRRAGTTVLVGMLLLGLGSASETRACPNCREALANEGSDGGRQAVGFGWSILFMMAMPFTLLGTGSLLVARAVRRGALPEL